MTCRCGSTENVMRAGSYTRLDGTVVVIGRCRECNRKRCADWRGRNREKVYENVRRQYARDREKVNARCNLNYHMKRGHVKRGPCEVDGCECKAHAHHDDYSKPLEVRWLCRTHHADLHRRMKEDLTG